MSRRAWLAVIGVLLAILLWVAFVWEPAPGDAKPEPTATAALPPGGDFTLASADGPVSLAGLRGKVVLIYFGYTFCPDVCPTSLDALGRAFALLTPEEQAQVVGLFVSIDPERDTLEMLKTYAPFFHPRIVGLGGTPDQVARVAGQYGARYAKQKARDGNPYTVDHSSYTSLVGRDGRLAEAIPHATPPTEIAARIRKALAR